jgi:hypothetical protein
MGTNFYWHESGERKCSHCKTETPSLHIGKSSAGWCFALRIHPEEGIRELDDWKAKWESGGKIFDEYDEEISIPDMLEMITERKWDGDGWTPKDLRDNGARLGPNGLARHGYGASSGMGTYDLCTGEFS